MAENIVEPETSKLNDEAFFMECIKHNRNPLLIDAGAVAKVLGYSNPVSVSNRLGKLKKKWNIRLSSTVGPIADDANEAGEGGASPVTPRKRGRAPKKSGLEGAEAQEGSPAKTPRRSGGGRKRKTDVEPAIAPKEEQAENGDEDKKEAPVEDVFV